ncbi:MAG: tetratricopeptide repeat protein [Terriglobales bacterium]
MAFRSTAVLMGAVLWLACWFAAALPANAQETSLTVRVVLFDEMPVPGAHVVLTKQSGLVVDQYTTDERGAVIFGVGPGIYLLLVSGMEIESAVGGPFEIFDLQPSDTEYVRVRLKPGRSLASAGSATVSTMDLKAPQGARKEYEKGRRAAEVGDWSKATKHFERAVALYPQYASAHNGLGLALEMQEQREAARQAFQRALDVDAKFARPYVHLARLCLADNKPSQALALMEKGTALEPSNPEGLTLLAQAQLASGKPDDALATARKVHSMPHGGFALAHIIAGIVLENKRALAEAATEYAAFLQEAPQDPDAPRIRAALKKLPKKP